MTHLKVFPVLQVLFLDPQPDEFVHQILPRLTGHICLQYCLLDTVDGLLNVLKLQGTRGKLVRVDVYVEILTNIFLRRLVTTDRGHA